MKPWCASPGAYQALLHSQVWIQRKLWPGIFQRHGICRFSLYRGQAGPIAAELFRDIDKDTVDFVDNYDATMKEPTLLPVSFPTILVNNNVGIAVGMASSICSFNLKEV